MAEKDIDVLRDIRAELVALRTQLTSLLGTAGPTVGELVVIEGGLSNILSELDSVSRQLAHIIKRRVGGLVV